MNRYPEYKESGIEWLGEIPSHWSVAPLKYLASFFGGGTPDKENEAFWNGDIPWVSPKDMKSDLIVDTEDHITEAAVRGSATRILEPGAVLVVVRSGILRHTIPVATNAVPVALNQDMKAIAPGARLDADYLRYLIRGNQASLLAAWRKQGATVESIEQEHLANSALPLPPIDEQRQLAAYLDRKTDEIDTIIQKKRALIALLREQRTALIHRAVTKGLNPDVPLKDSGIEWLGEVPEHWMTPKIKFVAQVESGHTPSRQHPEYWEDCYIPWFTLGDVWQLRNERTTTVTETKEQVSDLGLTHSSARLLPAGAVILSRTASVGFSGVLGVDMATSQDFVCWICGPVIRPMYLLYVLRAMKGEFRRLLMGSTHKTIYMPDAYEFVTSLPPVEEQDAIVARIEQATRGIDGLIDRETQATELLHELRNSLVSEVVTGKIDVGGVTAVEGEEATADISEVNAFKWWIMANYILNRMARTEHFGRITFVKVLFVVLYEMRLRLTDKRYKGPHQRWDYGPHHPSMTNALEASLQREGYWRKLKVSDERQYHYLPLARSSDPDGHFEKYWGDRRGEVDRVIDLFTKVASKGDAGKRAEIIATLYAAWNDLLLAGLTPTDDEIVREVRENWHEHKLTIAAERWHNGLAWMRAHGLVPSGFGDPVIPMKADT